MIQVRRTPRESAPIRSDWHNRATQFCAVWHSGARCPGDEATAINNPANRPWSTK